MIVFSALLRPARPQGTGCSRFEMEQADDGRRKKTTARPSATRVRPPRNGCLVTRPVSGLARFRNRRKSAGPVGRAPSHSRAGCSGCDGPPGLGPGRRSLAGFPRLPLRGQRRIHTGFPFNPSACAVGPPQHGAKDRRWRSGGQCQGRGTRRWQDQALTCRTGIAARHGVPRDAVLSEDRIRRCGGAPPGIMRRKTTRGTPGRFPARSSPWSRGR